jgi:hypothetical protein
MKHVGPIELQNVSLTPEALGRRVKRRSLFRRLIVALHVSRRRQARNLIRSYRHLLADDILVLPASPFLDINNENESRQNANADQTTIRTDPRADRT